MEKDLYIDKTFKKINFSEKTNIAREFENCSFVGCLFMGVNLSAVIFSDCSFTGCDFSMARITGTSFQHAEFKECKLLGLHFEDCNEFLLSLGFEKCILNFSSFQKLELKNLHFYDCELQEVDFTEAKLPHSVFRNCNLAAATFINTQLFKADFKTAYNYSIDPETNQIKKAQFSMPGLIGLLDKYDIEVTNLFKV